MKTLILENDWELDIPEELIEFAKRSFPNYEVWDRFKSAFWPENLESTFVKLGQLKTGDNILFRHVFCGFYQLEVMIQFLAKMMERNIKLNIYNNGLLDTDLLMWYKQRESELCPCGSGGWEMGYKKCEQFKADMNKKMLEVLDYHQVFEIWSVDYLNKISSKTLTDKLKEEKRNCKHYMTTISKGKKTCDFCGVKLSK